MGTGVLEHAEFNGNVIFEKKSNIFTVFDISLLVVLLEFIQETLRLETKTKCVMLRINCKVRIVQRVIGRNTQRVSKHVETCQNVSKYTAYHYVLSS